MTDIESAVSLLKVAICPTCDGQGVILVEGWTTEAGCCENFLGTGECCGNAIAVPVPTQEIEQCQWCAEREELISKYDTLEV